jgi:hypothetical protein
MGLTGLVPAPGALAAEPGVVVTPTCANNAPGSGTVALTQASFVLCPWHDSFTDQGEPIAESSPVVATLDDGPAVVVGDRSGYLYAYNLSDGTPVTGWPVHTGAPVDATPSVAPISGSSGPDDVFIGTGDAAHPYPGGYKAYEPDGTLLWDTPAPNPPSDAGHADSGVEASLTVTDIGGTTGVFAGSLGQESYALSAAAGKVLTGWPFFSADTNFSTAASADLYGNGQDELVMGGSSTAGVAEGQGYSNGGHVRVLDAQGALIYDYDTDQEVVSSPAVGDFLPRRTTGIVVGTGARFAGTTDTDRILALTTRLGLAWSDNLDGYTTSSPALADLQGNGQLDVVEGTDTGKLTGSVYALDGTDGTLIWEQPAAVSRIIGSVTTADLSGAGYQDVLVPTIHGVEVLDGRNGTEIAVLGQHLGFQNSPLITDDPNGTVGITIAGYYGVRNPPGKDVQSQGVGIIQHYEIWGSNAALPAGVGAVGPGSWPMFHHDPSLSGVASTLPGSGTATPTALIAQAGDTQVSLSWTAPTGTGASSTTGYNVYEATSPGHESGAPINGATPLSGTHLTVTGLSDWQTYYFEVTALNSAGEGAPSNEASATPSAPAPPPPPPPVLTTTTTLAPTTTTVPPSTTTTAPTTTAPATTTTTSPTAAKTHRARPVVTALTKRAALSGDKVELALSCRGAPCNGSIRLWYRHTLVGDAPYRLPGGRRSVFTVALDPSIAGSLAAAASHEIVLGQTVTVAGGPTVRKTLRLSS